MAHIFSINFLHRDELQSAIVSVRTTPFFTEYTINPMDENLIEELPSTKIVSSAPGQFSFSGTSKNGVTPLMKDIIRAIAQHLQPTTV